MQGPLTGVAKGGMTDIVRETGRLDEIGIDGKV
jgi:hypothetical protein